MKFLCHIIGAFFTVSRLQWNPIAPSIPQKNHSILCPIILIDKIKTVSKYEKEKHIDLVFHGVKLEHDFYYDFLIEDKIGVELKAMSEIIGEFEAQIINYLHVSNHKLGLLLNFGATSLEYKWYPNEWHHRQCASIG